VARWFLLIGSVLLTLGIAWWVVQVTKLEPADRNTASGYGQFVLAAIGLVIIVGGGVTKAFGPAAAPDLDQLADALALAMPAEPVGQPGGQRGDVTGVGDVGPAPYPFLPRLSQNDEVM
jgi:hypothetical protein